ncbi:MAG: hypothetical protein PHX83_14535 [Acidobacteriia bacterium]|nr:hypothetical protein [Terriglobia bacterium]
MNRGTGIKAVVVGGLTVGVAAVTAMMVRRKKQPAQGTKGAAGATPSLTQYPVPPVPQVPGATVTTPGVTLPSTQVTIPSAVPSGDMQQKVAAAIASNNPAQMRAVAAELRAAGNTTGAQSLEQIATLNESGNAAIQAGVAAVTKILQGTPATSSTAPTPAQPTPAQPLPSAPTPQPVSVTVPTTPWQLPSATVPQLPTGPVWPETNAAKVDLAARTNAMLKQSKPYSENTALVKQFQSQEGLTPVDGLWGPGSAVRLAQQYGIVPAAPYYWSKDKTKVPAQKAAYAATMAALAAKDPARAAEWQNAAIVATGQSASVPTSSIPTSVPAGIPSELTSLAQGIPGLSAVLQQVTQQVPTAPEGILTSTVAWPETDPGRRDVANRMNVMLAARKPYSEDASLVKAFQAQESLSPVDGLYGPGTAQRLAEDYGIIPTKPYYWSKDKNKIPAQKSTYRAALTALSVKDPLRAAQWLAAANV